MPDTTVRVEYIGAVQNFSEVTITGNQQVWRIGSSAFVETGRASQLVASGKFRSLANDPAMLPANQAKVTATSSAQGVGYCSVGDGAGVPISTVPGGFAPLVVASLVAGATASASSGLVTVSATAHGIPASQNGKRFYYPGSPSIPSGIYGNFTVVSANSVTFAAPGIGTVASESVNSGAAFVSAATICTIMLPAKALGKNGYIQTLIRRGGDALAIARRISVALGGSVVAQSPGVNGSAFATASMTFFNLFCESAQTASSEADGRYTSSAISQSVNTAIDQPLAVTVPIDAAGAWQSIDAVVHNVVSIQ